MRIVIDMQGAQSENRYRSIGQYTLSFAKAVVRNCGEHEILLALSDLFPNTIEPLRAEFDGLLPQENIRVWSAPGPTVENKPGNEKRRRVAELLREAFLASLKPDLIHICSLFEGYVDDAVTSIGRFDHHTLISVTLHDLINLPNNDHCLTEIPYYKHFYFRKIMFLRMVNICLSASNYSGIEDEKYFNTKYGAIVNTSKSCEPYFLSKKNDITMGNTIIKKNNISKKFLLYTGESGQREIFSRLIQIFANLPSSLRTEYQLVLAGKISLGDLDQLNRIARSAGLIDNDVRFTGYVSDKDLAALYNLCTLFVFPSWREGFGLPALEAMACGAPVISANTSSLPEAIGLKEALFDPFDVTDSSNKMTQALQDDAFRMRLRKHGLRQSKLFSWDKTARRAIAAWETLVDGRQPPVMPQMPRQRKPKLAFVSPMPPERTGIANYSAEILPALARYYDIELILAQDRIEYPWITQNGHIRDVQWLRDHHDEVDRVLYQMGNSPFHKHIFFLLREIPGIVVLHDFYLSDLLCWLEFMDNDGPIWEEALYASHGYTAVAERFHTQEAAKHKYPSNIDILQNALGVIVHSEHASQLIRTWYGDELSIPISVIPLCQEQKNSPQKIMARNHLGFKDQDFIICNFGFLAPTKLNDRLIDAWINSILASGKDCYLIFVGEICGGDYGEKISSLIHTSTQKAHIRITGFISDTEFQDYLAASDVAVQLRTRSRGETSSTVLHCLAHALPTIVNAHGSMAELDPSTVWMLPDDFSTAELTEALETLWRQPERRRDLGAKGRKLIRAHHSPESCASQYAEAIERFHSVATTSTKALIRALVADQALPPNDAELRRLATDIAVNLPLQKPLKRLFLDISATCRTDLRTGIERVARALTLELLQSPPSGYRVEPVYLCREDDVWIYRYAHRYTLSLLHCPENVLQDEVVDLEGGDILLLMDLSCSMTVEAGRSKLYKKIIDRGVLTYALLFDLLPIRMPIFFPPGTQNTYGDWLRTISLFTGTIAISRDVANDFRKWLQEHCPQQKERRPLKIGWIILGADIENSEPTKGMPPEAMRIVERLRSGTTFLMVGTVEPRKGYLQALQAFESLWQGNSDINLAIVGHEGWKDVPTENRHNIPKTINKIRTHPENGRHLFWLEGISDEYLEHVYAASSCLIAASYGEGFGLPLIEAAQHHLPIIARDIPVFREVAGEHAFYFPDDAAPEVLVTAVRKWLTLHRQGKQPLSDGMPYFTWKESAAQLLTVLLPGPPT